MTTMRAKRTPGPRQRLEIKRLLSKVKEQGQHDNQLTPEVVRDNMKLFSTTTANSMKDSLKMHEAHAALNLILVS